MRQKGFSKHIYKNFLREIFQDFIEMFNKVSKELVDETSEKKLRSRFSNNSNSNYSKNELQENGPISSLNMELLNEFSNNEIEIRYIDAIQTNCKIPQFKITETQNQGQSETGDLANKIELKIGEN